MLFVSNIPENMSNTLVEELLATCGKIKKWTRLLNEKGKNLAFGFLEYYDPISVLNCLQFVKGLNIQDRFIEVMVEGEYDSEVNPEHPDPKKMGAEIEEILAVYHKQVYRARVISEYLDEYYKRMEKSYIPKVRRINNSEGDDDRYFLEKEEEWLKREGKIHESYREYLSRKEKLQKKRHVLKEEDLRHLDQYDDDKANEGSHIGKTQWRKRRRMFFDDEKQRNGCHT